MKKYRVWVKGKDLEKDCLVFHTTETQKKGTLNFINTKYPNWEIIIVYDKKTNDEVEKYVNNQKKPT